MSTSDSGRGNSVTEDTLDASHGRVNTSVGGATQHANGATHQKQVHFIKPLVTTSHQQYQPPRHHPIMTSSLERDYKRHNGASSPAYHSANPNTLAGGHLKPRAQQLSTFSSPSSKTALKSATGSNQNGGVAKRQPARVSFQCPVYDTTPPFRNPASKTIGAHAPSASALKQDTGVAGNGMPMSKIDECVSSTENLSDDSASTMSGSYVLQQDDAHAHGARAATPTTLSPSVCQVLPNIQDSIV